MKNRVVVVVEGGVVQTVASDQEIEFYLIDLDNIKDGGDVEVGGADMVGRKLVDKTIGEGEEEVESRSGR